MGLFGGSPKKRFLGVDIGSGGIKVVELVQEKGRFQLYTYGYSEGKSEHALSPFDDPKGTADLLQKICKEAGMISKFAVSALPLSSVFSTIVSVPYTKDDRVMKEAIQSEARKLSPLPLEDMITYSTFIDPVPKASDKKEGGKKNSATPQTSVLMDAPAPRKHIRVLVTGSAKTLVQKYVEIFKLAKLELSALDTESFALIRSLIGKDKSSIMMIDIGYHRSNITIVEKGIPFFTRSINIGGKTITASIVEKMGLTEEEAEQMKKDLGTMGTPTTNPAGTIPPVLETFIQPLLNEIRYCLEWYAKMDMRENSGVEKVILTGGSSHLPNMPAYLASRLNMNVYVGDPWARVLSPEPLRPALDEIGPRLAVSIGLAMREEPKP